MVYGVITISGTVNVEPLPSSQVMMIAVLPDWYAAELSSWGMNTLAQLSPFWIRWEIVVPGTRCMMSFLLGMIRLNCADRVVSAEAGNGWSNCGHSVVWVRV